MNHRIKYYSLIFLVSLVLMSLNILPTKNVEAADCADPSYAKAHESYCRQQLAKYIEEEAKLLKQLEQQNKKSNSYASEVKKITTEINSLKAKINVRSNAIALLKNDINTKKSKIQTLEQTIEKERESLAQLIRKERELDNKSIIALVLSQDTISDAYSDINTFASIKNGIRKSVNQIKGIKNETESQKKDLESQRDQEANVKYELENAKKKSLLVEAEQKKLLSESKNQEVALAKIAAEKKAQAEKIRSALIQLQGSGISNKSISFGEAYDYAKKAAAKTGVRSALILAIMQQETGFGNNVGGCYVTNLKTGDGKGIKSGLFYEKVMGTGSLGYFERITKSLGLNWKTTPVSCPIDIKRHGTATKYYSGRGYGGAMGYTQFIPSTWALIESRVESYLGVKVANPWNPEHAVMATAIFLEDLGASKKTYTAEHSAACNYYGSCSSYATSVMKKAASIQLDIYKLENT